MANRAQKMAREVGIKCEVLDEARMQKMGMGSLLSVSLGSEQPAKLIVLRYTPAKSTGRKGELLALVGKGITFDTGGISIKPAEGMEAMKYDMSGGATVIGTMRAIALLSRASGARLLQQSRTCPTAKRPAATFVTAMTGRLSNTKHRRRGSLFSPTRSPSREQGRHGSSTWDLTEQ